MNLALFRVLWPRGNHHEANIWLFHANGQVRFYQPSQISKAMQRKGKKEEEEMVRQSLKKDHDVTTQLNTNKRDRRTLEQIQRDMQQDDVCEDDAKRGRYD